MGANERSHEEFPSGAVSEGHAQVAMKAVGSYNFSFFF